MILRHPVTGHEAHTDDASAEFWTAAGYRSTEDDKPKRQARKATAKKAAAKKTDDK